MIKVVDKINKFAEFFSGMLLGVMVIAIFIQVLVRFVFTYFNVSMSVPWAEELARYLMFWVVFLGGAVAVRRTRMIAMEAIKSAVPEKIKKMIEVIAHIISLIFYSVIFIIGLNWALTSGTSRVSTAMNMPMIFVYLAMAVGALLMVVNTITIIVDSIFKKRAIIK